MAQLPDLETWAKEAGERGAQYALKYLEEEYGVSIRRLIELAQADREGRCFTSPVKIGQTVWFVRDPKRNPENIVETTVEKIVCKRGGTYMKLGCNSMYETSCNSIGKTVFLTRAEAQAALRREQDEQIKP